MEIHLVLSENNAKRFFGGWGYSFDSHRIFTLLLCTTSNTELLQESSCKTVCVQTASVSSGSTNFKEYIRMNKITDMLNTQFKSCRPHYCHNCDAGTIVKFTTT